MKSKNTTLGKIQWLFANPGFLCSLTVVLLAPIYVIGMSEWPEILSKSVVFPAAGFVAFFASIAALAIMIARTRGKPLRSSPMLLVSILVFLFALGSGNMCCYIEGRIMARRSTAINLLRESLPKLSAGMSPEQMPKDPFKSSTVLQARKDETGAWQVWSIGPDKVDQKTTLIYDPTNGVVSDGDLVLPRATAAVE